MALLGLLKGKSRDAAGQYRGQLERINELSDEIRAFSDERLRDATDEFRSQLQDGKTLDDVLYRAFAVVREAATRVLNQTHYDVQVIGGLVLHEGKIAQMRTGEGKTLSATLPTYLNALEGKGVHVVTVNDYLARRDAVWMGQVYHALGLRVGVITHDQAYVYDPDHVVEEGGSEESTDESRDELGGFHIQQSYLRPVARKEAYEADITYGTNNEFGFDYLRDNLVQKKDDKVQRGFHYAIVDEVDSILIDEARTPLIISAPDETGSGLYTTFARIVPQLQKDTDYTVDEKLRSVALTQEGITKVEKSLGISNIYDPSAGGSVRHVHALEQALKASVLFTKDKDYVVRDGAVVIVDEFTGRMMPGRRFSEGLHQAIEAKEAVAIQKESRTVATVTFQNYFRMYGKLAGMTGTALTNKEEFLQVYQLDVVVVPTNKPLARTDYADVVFMTEEGKYIALVDEIRDRHEHGQPVLVGTTSIEKNEHISSLLKKAGIKHEILNAKNHEQEGEIVAQAGRKGSVTVATNMAGRGVDIILGGNPPSAQEAQEVREAGGLHIVGTERHDARRIDDQLRGRAGRQGDPGSGQFFLSLEDKMVRVFGGERIQKLMTTLRIPQDQPIESKMVSGAIENAQKKIEGMNFDTRKHLLEYDQVLNRQRTALYKKRDSLLDADEEEIYAIVDSYSATYAQLLVAAHCGVGGMHEWDMQQLAQGAAAATGKSVDTAQSDIENIVNDTSSVDRARQGVIDYLQENISVVVEGRKSDVGKEDFAAALRWVILRTIDTLWTEHLEAMEHTRDAVRLRAYGQRDPLAEYKNEGSRMFEELERVVAHTVVVSLGNISIQHRNHTEAQQVRTTPKKNSIGRNDPCTCGSGKKYKKCHGA
ncbi:MAG: preprotein translocase subunit SecA [Candidatus Spechtbacteria bacterium SB0662_bin_43]|uniref:Protein translocase subunit SecA n=1 Tax=Candidatus Spechtbacteria bacterium SB0662_bin_43 TaxID=2604897 RepID=A0A845DB77_9BACT|nr:preprotein translocase subunit SecA [Candidatus Spechtbacteria bacterium SB0662_bin_43]